MKLAIYDFDGTYIRTHTLSTLYKLWGEKHINDQLHKKIWRKILLRYFFHKFHLFGWSKPKFRAYAMQITGDLFAATDKKILFDFLEDFYQEVKKNVSETVRERLIKDKKAGYYTILLSGNFDIILKPFLKEGFDQVIGTEYEKNGEFLETKDINVIINTGKKEIIQSLFPDADFSNSKAYADSYYDLPIFELVGHQVAVNPDKKLMEIAIANNYEIIHSQ